MLPIHLAIGVVEGLVTAAVVLFVYQGAARAAGAQRRRRPLAGVRLKPVLIGLAVAAVVAGGALSWFASTNADGLEWSIAKVTGTEELQADTAAHDAAAGPRRRRRSCPTTG